MLGNLFCELSILQILFWGFMTGMIYQLGREIVQHIFNRNQNEENS